MQPLIGARSCTLCNKYDNHSTSISNSSHGCGQCPFKTHYGDDCRSVITDATHRLTASPWLLWTHNHDPSHMINCLAELCLANGCDPVEVEALLAKANLS